MATARKRAPRTGASDRQQALAAVLAQPWLITPNGLEHTVAEAMRVLRTTPEAVSREPEAVSASAEDGVEYSWRLRRRDGVGQIRVYGPLVSSSSWMGWYYDTYDVLANEITQALRDPTIRALVLTFDSPGGHVAGCQELAEIVRAARGTKPLVAFVEGEACSAAYWVASACDEIVAGETSVLGCLGAQAAYLDASKLMEEWGLREVVVTSSQTPEKNRPPTESEGLRVWQQMLDDMAEVFLGTVAMNRGVTRADVDARFGQGAVLVGARAVAAGLADRLGTYETLHAELASGTWRSSAAASNGTSQSTAAAAAQQQESFMPPLKKIGASKSAKPTAAAFEANTEVKALASHPAIAEGDVGTVSEVRDGTFYLVDLGDTGAAWMPEDELETSTAATDGQPADQQPADQPQDQPAARTNAGIASASAIAAARAEGVTAENARILGILALRNKASIESLLELAKDPNCTPESAAHRLLTGAVPGARSDALGNLAADEAALPEHLSSVDPGAEAKSEGARMVDTLALFNPRAVARKPRG